MPYTEVLALQHELAAARHEGRLDRDLLLVVVHPPVFTLGRRGGEDHLGVTEAFLAENGISLVRTERGGDITYHGPGQLVAYPIVGLEARRLGVADYVTLLEEAMIRTAADFGVTAERNPRNRGVWVGEKKLGSIGIAVQRGVSFHGLALNIDPRLEHFSWITPCGLAGVSMTSLAHETGREVSMAAASRSLTGYLATLFDIEMEEIGREGLLAIIEKPVGDQTA